MEERGGEVPLHVLGRVLDREAAAECRPRKAHLLRRDRVAAGGAHAKRVPVVVDDDAGGSARDQRVAVALATVVVGVGDGGVEDVGGGRKRAN
jgi:hypothetical protein